MASLKILHYIPDFWSLNNTQAQKILRLITAVSRQTESYLVTSSPFTKEMEQQLKDVYKLQMVYLPKLSTSNPLKIYHAYKVIKECLMQLQPNLVHVHGSWNPLLFVMERTARRKGYVTCVSIYGGMAPEVLNTEFFKHRLLPLIFYQAPLIRHSTSLIAQNEKEWKDIRNLNLKKRVEILPQALSTEEGAQAYTQAILAAYQKAIDSSYKNYITPEEEMLVERCLITATTMDAKFVPKSSAENGENKDKQALSFRRIYFYAYDEDVLDKVMEGAKRLSYNFPEPSNIGDIPRYADRKAKKRGGIEQLQLPVRKLHITDEKTLEYKVITSLLRVQKEGIKRLTLRHKAELYNLFRNDDFDEGIVGEELTRLRLKSFTKKIQKMLHELYNMPVGYDIF